MKPPKSIAMFQYFLLKLIVQKENQGTNFLDILRLIKTNLVKIKENLVTRQRYSFYMDSLIIYLHVFDGKI